MKTTKPAVILLALVLLIAAGAQSAEKSEAQKISETYIASCLFKITTDEAVLPLNEFAVSYLMGSSGVAGKAAREVLDISPDVASELFEIEEIYSIDSDSVGGTGGMGGYGGGMGLPADATPGAYTPGASKLGITTTRRFTSALSTPTTPARSPSRTSAVRTTRSPTTATTPTRRTITSRATTRTSTPARRTPTRPTPTPRRTPTVPQPLPSTTEQTILFRLQVGLPEDAKPAAEEFMIALIDNLRSALSGASDQYSAKLNRQLKLADKEAIQAEQQLILMQRELRDISGSRDLSRYAILRDISSLRQKLQTTIMKRASDESLYEATTNQIAEEQARRKKLVEDDPITREFKSILDVHQRRLKETQKLYESGRASAADLEDIKEKIIRARIDLAKRQEEVSNPPGGIVLGSYNNELANLSTKIALAQQEINSLEEQLKEAEELLGRADDYELLSLKADIARQNLEETLLWRARLGRNIRSIQPPDVTVIGAE